MSLSAGNPNSDWKTHMGIIRRIGFILFLAGICAVLPVMLCAAPPERELYDEAESRFLNGNYMGAYEIYEEFTGKYPLSDLVPDAQYRKAVCLFRMDRYDEALAQCRLVTTRYRSTRFLGYVPFWMGVAHYKTGGYEEARDNLTRFLDTVDDPVLVPSALLHKALVEVSLKRFDEAVGTMEELGTVRGESGFAGYESVLYSYTLLVSGSYKKLIGFLQTMDMEVLPDELRDRILLYSAEAYLRTGDMVKAEEAYERLVERGIETAPVAYRRLYHFAQERGDFARKEYIVQQAEKQLGAYPEILQEFWLQMGIESFQRGELKLAEYFLNKVWNAGDPGDVSETVPLYLSRIYVMQGKEEKAAALLESYLEAGGSQGPHIHLNLGSIYISEGNYSSASRRLGRYVAEYPQGLYLQNARYLLAYSEYKQDRLESALDYCNTYLEAASAIASAAAMRNSVIRIKARILIRLDRQEEALEVLRAHVAEEPEDAASQLSLLKQLFIMGSHDEVIGRSSFLLKNVGDEAQTNPYGYVLVHYLRALSLISQKKYDESKPAFRVVSDRASEVGLDSIAPYVLYYTAWAEYRTDNLRRAIVLTDDFIARFPENDLVPDALYLGGWCSYSVGDYEKAEASFETLTREGDEKKAVRALFLQAKCLVNLGREIEASSLFSTLYENHPESEYADDALFEYAALLPAGEMENAAEAYRSLWERYPSSPLAGEALYKRGELYLSALKYEEAGSAFRLYSGNFPRGELRDAALYFEGITFMERGKVREALVLWEEVISSYLKSPYRPDAINGSAEAYASMKEYARAEELFALLIHSYPDYSGSVDAEFRIEQVRYLKFGLSGREAELTARISREGGADTVEGRRAMIDLARLYIYEEEGKIERAFQLLSRVLQEKDADTSAAAGVLLGEYYFKQDDFERASREFFYASTRNPSDRELMAYAMYRAAHAMQRTGNDREVEEIVGRLRRSFPASPWTEKGEKLIENEGAE